MNANPIFSDVDGAPVKIGATVKVVIVTDGTGDYKYLGEVGEVIYLEYECGCGQTYPEDPMIGVRFDQGTSEFWIEELRIVDVAT